MAQFQYKARDGAGGLVSGAIAAATQQEAQRMLRDEGKFVVALSKAAQNATEADGQATRTGAPGGRIKREHVITFAQQLAVMVDTGVPITEALDCAVDQAETEAMRAVLQDVNDHVKSGGDLSGALEKHPKVFPTVMISLIRASEASGTMGRMLQRVTQYLTKEMYAVRRLRGTLSYPAMMLFMLIAVTVFLLTFVMPRFLAVYQAKGASLPMPTQIVLVLSNAMTDYWPLWVVGVPLAVVGGVLGVRTETGRRWFDGLKINTPIIGPLMRKLYINRTCRTMSMMVAAGLPVLDVVDIVRRVTPNVHYDALWERVRGRLEEGADLSGELFRSPLISKFVARMISSGEQSGRLVEVLDRVAEFTEQEFDDKLKQTSQFIEPALITLMGGVVGFMALAMLLPVFTVSRVVTG